MWSFCMFVCQQDNWKRCGLIGMKFSGSVHIWPTQKRLNFWPQFLWEGFAKSQQSQTVCLYLKLSAILVQFTASGQAAFKQIKQNQNSNRATNNHDIQCSVAAKAPNLAWWHAWTSERFIVKPTLLLRGWKSSVWKFFNTHNLYAPAIVARAT